MSWGGPQMPTGKRPNGRAEATNGNGCAAPACCQVSVIVGCWSCASIGATPSARLGAWVVVAFAAACVRVTIVAGTVLVNISENSTTTTNGRAAEPSGVASCALAGSAPDWVITAWASAAPPAPTARYLAM